MNEVRSKSDETACVRVVQKALDAMAQLMRNWSEAASKRLGMKSAICQSAKWNRTP